jgi:hypothetical protein
MDTLNFEENVDHSNDGVGPRIEQATQRLSQLGGSIKAFVSEHPGACLLGALAVGYLAARVARRGS